MKSVAVLRRAGQRDMAIPSESVEQRNLFSWAATVPELALMYAVPNGGSRRPVEAAIMKAEGVKAGVPDIHLPIRRGHLTLYIELKRQAFALTPTNAAKWGTVSTDQLWWLEELNELGHWAVVCRGCEHAKQTLQAYLDDDQNRLEELNQWWLDLSTEQLRKVTKKPNAPARRRAPAARAKPRVHR